MEMEAAKRSYERYENNASAVKEVGHKLVELIDDNVKAIERYKKNLEEAEATGQDTSYYRRWINELSVENELLLDIEQYYRCKMLGDGTRIDL